MSNNLNPEKKTLAVSMLCEGNSIRSIERMTGIHRDTIMRLGLRVGTKCQDLLDERMRGLTIRHIQVDEIWGFIGAKKETVKLCKLDPSLGDVWVWVAIDAESKLIPSHLAGKRDKYHSRSFMEDIARRLVNRPQISSDALGSYPDAVERAFGSNVDYGSVIKTYSHSDLYGQARYSPPDILKVKKVVVQGRPNMRLCSTSFVEKQNHTMRMHCRRLSRLTNAFSKKRANFDAAIALHFAYYNFCKIHTTIRCTPAMQAGLEKSQWTVADLLENLGE